MSDKKIRIAVAGDVSRDTLTWPVKVKKEDIHWETGTLVSIGSGKVDGGALLLADFLREKADIEVLSQKEPDNEVNMSEKLLNSHMDVDLFPSTPGSKEKVYRIKNFRGLELPDSGKVMQLGMAQDDENAEMVILFDQGKGFLQDRSKWPIALTTPDKKPIVIYRMSTSPASWKSWEYIAEHHHEKAVVIINANALRDYGINISRCLSWERTAMDLKWQLTYNHKLVPLLKCANLVVLFGIDGAVCFRNSAGTMEASLVYDPVEMEDGYKSRYAGRMQGKYAAFTAAMAGSIADGLRNGTEIYKSVKCGARKGITAARRLLVNGFKGDFGKPGYDFKTIAASGQEADDRLAEVDIPETTASDAPDPDYWCMVKNINEFSIDRIAEEIVIKGQDVIRSRVPSGRFGKLCTIDRTEIESFRSISNLMKEYLKSSNSSRPLSIAVFGSPGSGKSFGVTEIAKSIAPELVVKLEFNISQFISEDEFAGAFHKVRDSVLKGKIPLVFFDEFDSAYHERLGWLKCFLAPMQDGEFKEGETMHPIGKAIFIFAGGTSSTFQAFCGDSVREEEKEAWMHDFINAKGPDFISRLRGFANIMGPNAVDDHDAIFILRRAMLLRALLERKASQIFDTAGVANIDPGVLSALLHITKYKHGVRSMEAIIDMSMLNGKDCWEPAYLPVKEQLSLHVDSDMFLRFVIKDVLLSAAKEKIARCSHEEYLKMKKDTAEKDDPAMVPYDELPESLKKSCRAGAEDISQKLQKSGYGFRPVTGEPHLHEFTFDEIERMAKEEHVRWVSERLAAGWRLGPVKDIANKISPYLVTYDLLEEPIKELDRSEVRNIPKLLANAGFEIYKIS